MDKILHMREGETLHAITLNPVSRINLIKYAGASGDFNPIHTIDDKAKEAGLPGVIAHGMWTMGSLTQLFSSYYDLGFIKEYTVRFKAMVFLEDIIELKAISKEVLSEAIEFDVLAINQHKKVVLKGTVIFQFIN